MVRYNGFTLIELVIVVAIVGILASVAMPVYQVYSGRAQLTEALSISSGVQTEVADNYMSRYGFFGGLDSGTNGIPVAADIQGNYVASVSVTDGVVSVTLGNSVSSFLAGEVLTLTPTTISGDAVIWDCSFSGEDRFAPTHCR